MNQPLWRMPKILLRLEGAAIFLSAFYFYTQQTYPGWVFWVLLLWPDISMLAYLINKKIGAMVYNLLHTYALPLLFATLSVLFSYPFGLQLSIIWLAHIGMDRAIGYGLKYQDNFKNTHLEKV